MDDIAGTLKLVSGRVRGSDQVPGTVPLVNYCTVRSRREYISSGMGC